MRNEIRRSEQQPAIDGSHQPDLVLIVEDEPPIAEALALIVDDAGYTTITASHGREALVLARTWHPALVFTDLMMPQLNGAELIAALRAEAEAAGETPPPIVLMSAAGAAYTREARADAVLRKPFDITEIEALLQRFLDPPHPGG
ncbi:MAG: response regulator [Ktedonobacterales bacterium]